MQVIGLKAFKDNYIWVIQEGEQLAIVDPGQAEPVLDFLRNNQLSPSVILLTHEHNDHIGGLAQMLEHYPNCQVIGPSEVSGLVDKVVKDGDSFDLFGYQVEVFKTAGHTKEHISYLVDDKLFCGDALFSAGCGRVFTGDFQAQFEALQVFNSLGDQILVYAGHEYTLTNLAFAMEIEPDNREIADVYKRVKQQREDGLASLPSTIGLEKKINLFMRAKSVEEFTKLRKKRDQF